jgi:hypothetical protein
MENIMMLATALGIVGVCLYGLQVTRSCLASVIHSTPFCNGGGSHRSIDNFITISFFALVVGGNLGGALGYIADRLWDGGQVLFRLA